MAEKATFEQVFDRLGEVLLLEERLIVAVLPDGSLTADLLDMHDEARLTVGLRDTIQWLETRSEWLKSKQGRRRSGPPTGSTLNSE